MHYKKAQEKESGGYEMPNLDLRLLSIIRSSEDVYKIIAEANRLLDYLDLKQEATRAATSVAPEGTSETVPKGGLLRH